MKGRFVLAPSPAELAALFGAVYFLWFIADGSLGVIAGLLGVGAGMIGSRLIGIVPGSAKLRSEHVWMLVILASFIALPFLSSGGFRTGQLTTAVTWGVIVLSLNLLSGYAGQVSFAHSAFVGLGAYTVAIVIDQTGSSILLATCVAALATAALGIVVGVPAVRLSGPYLAIATAGLALAFPQILKLQELSDFAGGPSGFSLFEHEFGPPVDWDWLTVDRWHYFLAFFALVAAVILVHNLINSASGRAMRALSESELAATSCGIDVAKAKVAVFSISAAMAGFMGVFIFILSNRAVSPDAFNVFLGVNFMVAMVLGGLSSIPGSVLGAFVFIFFYREGLDTITSETEDGKDQWLFLGGLLVASVLVFGSRSLRAVGTTVEKALASRYARLATTIAKLLLSVLLAVLVVLAYREGEGELFNATRLRNGITGLSLILFILFLPKGLFGLFQDLMELTWPRVFEGARRLVVADAEPQARMSEPPLVRESPEGEPAG
jgi:branched-chain amino acid transport system permease protein